MASGAGSWFQRYRLQVRKRSHCQESNEEQKVGEICLIRQVCSPHILLWWQNGNSKENSNFRLHAFVIQDSTSAQNLWVIFPSFFFFSFYSFWTDSINFPQCHVQPCTDAAIDDLLIHLVAERPFGWIYVPHFLCIINSVLWGKERNVMARPPQRNVPIWEEEFYRGEQLTASQYSAHIFLYNCITTNDKWGMFDSWLRCLTATVLARGPWQALDFCSKWVKHIRHYEGTEASRMNAEMRDPGRLLGTQLAKQMSF